MSWDTRIAAAQTIESIMKNLSENELIGEFFSSAPDETSPEETTSTSTSLSLDYFNLADLLRKNPILLSSDTQKYDLKDQDTSSSCSSTSSSGMGGSVASGQINSQIMSEKVRQQRHLLNLKLGIDVGGAAKLDTTEIFSDYDIISSAVQDTELATDSFDPNRTKRRLPDMPGTVIPSYNVLTVQNYFSNIFSSS